jgi:hypothetical protein
MIGEGHIFPVVFRFAAVKIMEFFIESLGIGKKTVA